MSPAPWIVAAMTVPGLLGVYASECQSLAVVAFFGLIWGVGAILFGRGIDLLGVGLSMPIMLGLTNVIGTLMPVVLRDPGELLTSSGIRLIAGVSVIVLGIVFYSIAGSRKEQDGPAPENGGAKWFHEGPAGLPAGRNIEPDGQFRLCFRGAFAAAGARRRNRSGIYVQCRLEHCADRRMPCECGLLHLPAAEPENGGVVPLRAVANWCWAALAGVLWYVSMMFYGMGGSFLGDAGTSVGWALMQSLAILTGNLAGLFSGEWRDASPASRRTMWLGLLYLLAGVFIVAFSK